MPLYLHSSFSPSYLPLFRSMPGPCTLLNGHPDSEFALFILQGLHQGYSICFQRPTPSPLHGRVRNMCSAYDHPEVIESYLAKQVSLQRIISISLHLAPSFPPLVQSIWKRSQSNKWRLIVDLTSPKEHSVNLCSIKYASVSDAVNIIQQLSQGTLLAKLDLRDAYWIVPVHLNDRPFWACSGETPSTSTQPFRSAADQLRRSFQLMPMPCYGSSNPRAPHPPYTTLTTSCS